MCLQSKRVKISTVNKGKILQVLIKVQVKVSYTVLGTINDMVRCPVTVSVLRCVYLGMERRQKLKCGQNQKGRK